VGTKHFDKAMFNNYLRTAIAFASERYVEMVYRTLVVNAPWVFTAMSVSGVVVHVMALCDSKCWVTP
jgi:hypothetical protein